MAWQQSGSRELTHRLMPGLVPAGPAARRIAPDHQVTCPRYPATLRDSQCAVAWRPVHGDQARSPLVPIRAPLRVTPPHRPPHPHKTSRTRKRTHTGRRAGGTMDGPFGTNGGAGDSHAMENRGANQRRDGKRLTRRAGAHAHTNHPPGIRPPVGTWPRLWTAALGLGPPPERLWPVSWGTGTGHSLLDGFRTRARR